MSGSRKENTQTLTLNNPSPPYSRPELNEIENLRREIFIQHKFLLSVQQTHNEIFEDERNKQNKEKTLLKEERDRLTLENKDQEKQLEALSRNNLALEKSLEQITKEKEEDKAEFLRELKDTIEEGRQSRAFYHQRLQQERNKIKTLTFELRQKTIKLQQTQRALAQAQSEHLDLFFHVSQQQSKGNKWAWGGTIITTSSISGLLLGALGIVATFWNPISWALMGCGILTGIYCLYHAKKDYELLPTGNKLNFEQATNPQPNQSRQEELEDEPPQNEVQREIRPQTPVYSSTNPCLFNYYNVNTVTQTNNQTQDSETVLEPRSALILS